MPEPAESHLHRWGDDEGMVGSSGLFDHDWYQANYPEVGDQADRVAHFCRDGWQRGLQPNPYFHPSWYAMTYRAEIPADENPLLHYIRVGERENAWPSPHFDPEWYREEYALAAHESPLQHYLLNRAAGTFSPLPTFDVADYSANHPECLATGQDPYLHWLQQPKDQLERPPLSASPLAAVLHLVGGNLETGDIPDSVGQDAFKEVLRLFIPLIPFDEAWYCRCYPDIDSAVKCQLIKSAHEHFVYFGFFEGRSPAPPGNSAAAPE
jgi:hypothetical protein